MVKQATGILCAVCCVLCAATVIGPATLSLMSETGVVQSGQTAASAAVAKPDFAVERSRREVRLLDASGEPYNDENEPAEGFEKRAVAKLLAGESFGDEIEQDGDRRYLRAATAIPVVMEKCIMCHENYRDVPKGQAIGAIGYRVSILSDGEILKPAE